MTVADAPPCLVGLRRAACDLVCPSLLVTRVCWAEQASTGRGWERRETAHAGEEERGSLTDENGADLREGDERKQGEEGQKLEEVGEAERRGRKRGGGGRGAGGRRVMHCGRGVDLGESAGWREREKRQWRAFLWRLSVLCPCLPRVGFESGGGQGRPRGRCWEGASRRRAATCCTRGGAAGVKGEEGREGKGEGEGVSESRAERPSEHAD